MLCDELESKDYNNGLTAYELMEENHLHNTAEKVRQAIAELKDIDSKNRSAYYKDLSMMAKDVEHHKYKRCLDNAWWCRKLSHGYALIAKLHRGWKIEEYYDKKAELYRKWRNRWLELADKIKEDGKC